MDICCNIKRKKKNVNIYKRPMMLRETVFKLTRAPTTCKYVYFVGQCMPRDFYALLCTYSTKKMLQPLVNMCIGWNDKMWKRKILVKSSWKSTNCILFINFRQKKKKHQWQHRGHKDSCNDLINIFCIHIDAHRAFE